MTNLTAANNMAEIITETNALSGDLLFSMFFLIIFLAFLIIFKKNSIKTVLVADSFFMVILAILCFVKGWVGQQLLVAPIIVFFASLIIYYFID